MAALSGVMLLLQACGDDSSGSTAAAPADLDTSASCEVASEGMCFEWFAATRSALGESGMRAECDQNGGTYIAGECDRREVMATCVRDTPGMSYRYYSPAGSSFSPGVEGARADCGERGGVFREGP